MSKAAATPLNSLDHIYQNIQNTVRQHQPSALNTMGASHVPVAGAPKIYPNKVMTNVQWFALFVTFAGIITAVGLYLNHKGQIKFANRTVTVGSDQIPLAYLFIVMVGTLLGAQCFFAAGRASRSSTISDLVEQNRIKQGAIITIGNELQGIPPLIQQLQPKLNGLIPNGTKTHPSDGEIATLKKEIADLKAEGAKLTAATGSAIKERDDAVKGYQKALTDQKTAVTALDTANDDLHAIRQQLTKQNDTVRQLTTELKQAQSDAKTSQQETTRLQQELATLQTAKEQKAKEPSNDPNVLARIAEIKKEANKRADEAEQKLQTALADIERLRGQLAAQDQKE